MMEFGLIGYPLTHSFSAKYFNDKFKQEAIEARYLNFEISDIHQINNIIDHHPTLKGLNVTIPYKEQVIPFLDDISPAAEAIGAVNVITIERDNGSSKPKLVGHNTDYLGFKHSIEPHITASHRKALVLGTGGASKAVGYALTQLGIEWIYVSRSKGNNETLTYNDLNQEVLSDYTVIINASPVGTYPNVNEAPNIPYNTLTSQHLLYDLVYNPAETLFLKKGSDLGAVVKNGAEMLTLQALAAWDIWNK